MPIAKIGRINMLDAIREKRYVRLFIIGILTLCLVIPAGLPSSAATSSQTTGKIDARKGTYLRKAPSTSSKKIRKLKNNVKVVITQEVFENKKSTSAKKRWYLVKVSGKTGYVRADQIDTIRYKAVTKQTTGSLNFRTGPSTKFAKKGSFKNGDKVTVLLSAKIRGEKYRWYKIKKGNRCYYASALYMKAVTSKKTTAKKTVKKTATAVKKTVTTKTAKALNTSSSAANKAVKTTYLVVKKADVTVKGTDIKVKGLRYPVTIAQGGAFSVMGTVTSPDPIDKVKVGVVNSSGNWVISSEKVLKEEKSEEPDNEPVKDADEENADAEPAAEPEPEPEAEGVKTFDIYDLDAKIKFGTLKTGTYKYKVIITVDGKNYTAGNYTFKVVKLNGPSKILNTAIALAWPEKTSVSTYKKHATTASKTAGKKVGVSAAADCGNFATIVLRTALGNKKIPNFLNAALKTKGSLPRMQAVARQYGFVAYSWNGNVKVLRPGDVLVYKKNGNTSSGAGQHIFIYLGNNKVAEANHPKHYYGYIDTKSPGRGVLSTSNRKFYYILRCVK